MSAENLDQLASDIRRLLGGWLERARAGQSSGADPSASDVSKVLLFLIDELAKLLAQLRMVVCDERQGDPDTADDAPVATIQGKGLLDTIKLVVAQVLKQPEALARHYAQFAGEALRVLQNGSSLKPEPGDFRFKDRLWLGSEFLRVLLQLYLAWSRSMQSWLDEQLLDQSDKKRVNFIFMQMIAALAPSNLPLNPAALRRADSTAGASVVDGVRQWIDDVIHNRAMPKQVKPYAYEIGKDLATTPGAVVHRNEQLELIQYAPQTPTVRSRPVLLIPPQINKYYVFDLRSQNSIIGHLIKSGLQMFTLSWRNPSAAEADWGLDTYVRSASEALDVACAITESPCAGLISACAGGLTALALMGYLAERGDRRVSSHSLLVTCLFPNQGSALELFATPRALQLARSYVRSKGIMEGDDLAKVFFWLRPTDLVWRYWINNYLLGKSPPPLDVLFWDNDSTRLPAALHGDFMDMYVHDVFRRPNSMTILGHKIDYGKVEVDSYVVGGEDDYLMPWRGCYHACHVFKGRHEFVLSTSGHVQSILRPPRIANTVYFTNSDTSLSPEAWRRTCTRNDGTWWTHWHQWLNSVSGDARPSPGRLGNADHPHLMPAPGRYVRE